MVSGFRFLVSGKKTFSSGAGTEARPIKVIAMGYTTQPRTMKIWFGSREPKNSGWHQGAGKDAGPKDTPLTSYL
jgi:hypothetical protein